MCNVTMMRELMKDRLNVAVEEIYQLFERTIFEYEEELRRTKEEKERQEELLEAVLNSRGDCHQDVQQVLLASPEVPKIPNRQKKQIEKDQTMDEFFQNQSEIKVENFPGCQDEEQLPCHQVAEAGVNTCPLTDVYASSFDVHLKREEDEGQSSQFDQSRVEESQNDAANISASGKPRNLRKSARTAVIPVNKQFSCPVCQKTFLTKATMTRHIKTHTGDRPFMCQVCSKSFTRRSHVTRHMGLHAAVKTHTGDRPFMCQVCSKSFTRRSHIKRHMSLHAAGKTVPSPIERRTSSRVPKPLTQSVPCLICAKGFSDKVDLERHTRIHTGKKPFSCDVCHRRSTRKYAVTWHKCVKNKNDHASTK